MSGPTEEGTTRSFDGEREAQVFECAALNADAGLRSCVNGCGCAQRINDTDFEKGESRLVRVGEVALVTQARCRKVNNT